MVHLHDTPVPLAGHDFDRLNLDAVGFGIIERWSRVVVGLESRLRPWSAIDIEGIGEYVPFLAPLSMAHSDDGKPKNRLNTISDEPMPFEGGTIRLRYIAALFRLVDACDVNYQRGPHLVRKILKDEMGPKDIRYWKAHASILAVKVWICV